jgi:hypothetical protein
MKYAAEVDEEAKRETYIRERDKEWAGREKEFF